MKKRGHLKAVADKKKVDQVTVSETDWQAFENLRLRIENFHLRSATERVALEQARAALSEKYRGAYGKGLDELSVIEPGVFAVVGREPPSAGVRSKA